MNCTVCGGQLLASTTDLPFKVSRTGIVILRNVPVLECGNCTEYLMEDSVFARVEEQLAAVDFDPECQAVFRQ